MNPLISQMLGRKARVSENVPVPVAAKRHPLLRNRDRRGVQRRSAAAAMMGMAEGDNTIIPDDAEEMDSVSGAGIKLDSDALEQDDTPETPETPDTAGDEADEAGLIQPRAALVAPDVTPRTLEPIDPSEVPAPPKPPTAPAATAPSQAPTQGAVNPMDVLLGRRTGQPAPPPETVTTAESAQATVNGMLGVSAPADLLGRGVEMPPPKPGDGKHIMEAFYRFGGR